MDIKEYLMEFYIAQNGETITEELAHGLCLDFAITDGSSRANGERYTMPEAKEIGEKMGVSWDVISLPDWYLVLNMMYSDYYGVAKKYGIADTNYFGDMALAWFNDVDSKTNKTFRYFCG